MDTRPARRPSPSRLGRWRWALLWLFVATALMAASPAFAGMAAGSPAFHTIHRFTTPFSGAAAYDHTRHARAGCGTSTSLPIYPAFNLTSGVAIWSSVASVRQCSNGTAGMAVQYTNAGLTNLSFSVPSNGTYNLTAHWNVSAIFTYNLSGGTALSGLLFFAAYRFAPVLCLFDVTAGTGGCSSGRPTYANFVGSANSTSWTNGTVPIRFTNVELGRHHLLTAGDRYYLRAFIFAHVQADSVPTLSTGFASAAMNLSGPNLGARLVAMKIYQ